MYEDQYMKLEELKTIKRRCMNFISEETLLKNCLMYTKQH